MNISLNHIICPHLSYAQFFELAYDLKIPNLEIRNDLPNLDFKKSQSLNLFPKTGIVISKDTLISESISKDTILLDIFNIKNDKVIVN